MRSGAIVVASFILFVLFLLGSLLPYSYSESVDISHIGPDYFSTPNSESKFVVAGHSAMGLFDMHANQLAINTEIYDLGWGDRTVWSPDETLIVTDTRDTIYFFDGQNLKILASVRKDTLMGSRDLVWGSYYYLDENNNLIYYSNNSIYQFQYLTESITTIVEIVDSRISESWAEFSYDGKYIGFLLDFWSWVIYDIDTLQSIEISNVKTSFVWIDFHPSRNLVAFTEGSDSGIYETYIQDLETSTSFPKFSTSFGRSDPIRWSKIKNEILVVEPQLRSDNKYEVEDLVKIIDFTTGQVVWKHLFSKGIVYDATITNYEWFSESDKIGILDRNGHDPSVLLIFTIRNGITADLSQISINFIGISFILFILSGYFYLNPPHFELIRK
ncbi:MAG: hypothetical protein IH840_14725, partial [Candidatus Heimdallarchaeota archaeon]|nr:hypothetical protein [Candidatus Heimdallarchaeota archaeon]